MEHLFLLTTVIREDMGTDHRTGGAGRHLSLLDSASTAGWQQCCGTAAISFGGGQLHLRRLSSSPMLASSTRSTTAGGWVVLFATHSTPTWPSRITSSTRLRAARADPSVPPHADVGTPDSAGGKLHTVLNLAFSSSLVLVWRSSHQAVRAMLSNDGARADDMTDKRRSPHRSATPHDGNRDADRRPVTVVPVLVSSTFASGVPGRLREAG